MRGSTFTNDRIQPRTAALLLRNSSNAWPTLVTTKTTLCQDRIPIDKCECTPVSPTVPTEWRPSSLETIDPNAWT
jgi:hypothetical protein